MKKMLSFAAALVVASFAYAETVSGLESYGDLTLVDSIDCGTTAPDHASATTASSTILNALCRTMAHQEGAAAYFSYRLGAGKSLKPGDMYLLVVEYPDDLPRTMTLLNRAMDSRNGFHTGNTVGDTLGAHIISQTHCESLDVPLSQTFKCLEQLMVLNEKVYPYNSTSDSDFLDSATQGFDVIFHLFQKEDALDSAGAAVKAIKLYHVDDESAVAAKIKYPAGAPRRIVT